MSKRYDIKKMFGSALKELRESKNLTQEQLAEYLELQSYQMINRIENGKSFTTIALFEKMCEFFDVSPAYFFSNRFYSFDKGRIDYMQQIKHMLPLLPKERLKDIYDITVAFTK